MVDLNKIGETAKKASGAIALLSTDDKNRALIACADALVENAAHILRENEKDISEGKKRGMPEHILDRLLLTEDRISAMADGLRQISLLTDPVGGVISMSKRPNGLLIGKKRVPLGVVGIIYEARPNVTSDVFGLCFKAGNAVILKGGSDALNSNISIVAVLRRGLSELGITGDAVQLIEDTSRETSAEFMRLNKYVDVLIPRGGADLIRAVVENSKIPVIETGTGNCHVYIDRNADEEMAVRIVENAKTQRLSVCNACESLLVHSGIAGSCLPVIANKLAEHGTEMRCDDEALGIIQDKAELRAAELSGAADEDDWGREYLDNIISVRIVDSVEAAIEHINKYSTGHSETIVTRDYDSAQVFLDRVDSACVYVNASTRFTDGFEFGYGGEIGISTQKLHARGPMGLDELTSYKYIIYGQGQIRG